MKKVFAFNKKIKKHRKVAFFAREVHLFYSCDFNFPTKMINNLIWIIFTKKRLTILDYKVVCFV